MSRWARIGLVGWLILVGVVDCAPAHRTSPESKQQQEFDRLHDEQEQGAREQRQMEQGSGIMNVPPNKR
jgi:hypothetical protein